MNRMASGMARELQPHHVTVVALAPGFVGTERVRAAFAAAGRMPPNLESPEYSGRWSRWRPTRTSWPSRVVC